MVFLIFFNFLFLEKAFPKEPVHEPAIEISMGVMDEDESSLSELEEWTLLEEGEEEFTEMEEEILDHSLKTLHRYFSTKKNWKPIIKNFANREEIKKMLSDLTLFLDSFVDRTDYYGVKGSSRVEVARSFSSDQQGVAVSAVLYRMTYKRVSGNFLRSTAGLGFQFPVIGSRKIKIAPGEGRLVFRAMPIGGDLDSARRRFYRKYLVHSAFEREQFMFDPFGVRYGRSIALRPAIELEAQYRLKGKLKLIEPSFRVWGQSNFQDHNDLRVVSDFSVQIEWKRKKRQIRIYKLIPNCLFDLQKNRAEFDYWRQGVSMNPRGEGLSVHLICAADLRIQF
tara:strand:+ start:1707 stop:2717 length:1011 start_codon:yes stop_codon:yes gene_type:complete